MVRQISGEQMTTSPTPSIDSLKHEAKPGNICGLEQDSNDDCLLSSNVGDKPVNSSSSSTSSGIGMSPLGSIYTVGTNCPLCGSIFSKPKVLHCFHTFCQACLIKVQEQNDKLKCPQCHVETQLGQSGVEGLLCDFGVNGLLEMAASGSSDYQFSPCTSCKSKEATALARCLTCANFLCPSCVMAHQFMHCFEGHHVTTLGEIYSKQGTRQQIQEVDSINNFVQKGKLKATEIQDNMKNLESSLGRLSEHYSKTQRDIKEAFKFYSASLEERKSQLLHELDGHFSSKQVAISAYTQKAQETVDKVYQLTDFIERLMKNASNREVLHFKDQLELNFRTLLNNSPEVDVEDVGDLKFCFYQQAIQLNIKNTLGFIRTKHDEPSCSNSSSSLPIGSGSKQPPISRPTPASVGNPPTMLNKSVSMSTASCNHAVSTSPSTLTNGLIQSFSSLTNVNSAQSTSNHVLNGIHHDFIAQNDYLLERQQLQHQQQSYLSGLISPLANLCGSNSLAHVPPPNSKIYEQGISVKRFNPTSITSPTFSPLIGNLENLGSSSITTNPWSSSSSEKMFQIGDSQQCQGFSSSSSSITGQMSFSSESMMDKLMSQSMFPPKSQIKRQKMIYHCKFGEFGVLEGQFTEPSGVAVNAQNDIIVADTNNHRVQIFDKEGRFKFQFGECGKRDGQLLYPNRVAVVRNSGDIIVTERSPTHQVQIYNQYGQFVRKFGATILQHPRGVCVDNKGRIIIVECKVMRVIIFDQMGNVLSKFGCSKHLEFPNGVMVNDRQEIFISDNRAHCVKVFNYEGVYQRQIGGEGITNYPIGVGINAAGEVTIADNHNNFNLTVFSQDGQLLSALESKVKHAQCFDVSLMDDGSVVLASKDYRLYIYRYVQLPQIGM